MKRLAQLRALIETQHADLLRAELHASAGDFARADHEADRIADRASLVQSVAERVSAVMAAIAHRRTMQAWRACPRFDGRGRADWNAARAAYAADLDHEAAQGHAAREQQL